MKPEQWKILYEVGREDHKALLVLLASDVALSIACFHAQQAVEKYMKAVLTKRAVAYPFTHDLLELMALLKRSGIAFPKANEIEKLNPFAVKPRYDLPPQITIKPKEVQEIVDAVADWCKVQLS